MPTTPIQAITTTLFTVAEAAVNRALRLDPASLKRLARIQGQVIGIQATSPSFSIVIIPLDKGVVLQQHFEGEPDALITGSITDLMALASAADKSVAFMDSSLEVSGNIDLTNELAEIFTELDLDWEGLLARFTGDTLAHPIGQMTRSTFSWMKNSHNRMISNLSEYLTEESKICPPPEELEIFYRKIDKLRLDTDRLEARTQRLQEYLNESLS